MFPMLRDLPLSTVLVLCIVCSCLSEVCKDDSTFLFQGAAGKDCEWAGKKPNLRCDKDDSITMEKVHVSCPETCGKCLGDCTDNSDFKFRNKKKKTCKWVSRKKKKKRRQLCKKNQIKKNCRSTCEQCPETQPPMPDHPSHSPSQSPSTRPSIEELYPCGCSTCTESVLNTFAGEYKCGARINYLRFDQGFSEEAACAQVAGVEYPVECDGCDPNRCNEISDPESSQKCGAAVNSSDDSNIVCQNDLWAPTGDPTMHCFAYGGEGDPCHLNNNNDPNDGLDKDPSLCDRGDTFYLWDEPDTQGRSYDWAGKAWYNYSRKFGSELLHLRSNGFTITSPLLKAGGDGVLANNLAEFFNGCGEPCNDKNDPAYIDIIAVNAFCGDFNGPSGCIGGASFIYKESVMMSVSNGNRPVYVTNWSRLGTSDPNAQIEAMDAVSEFFPSKNGAIKRVYWFGATDFGGGSSNNFLTNILSDSTTLGEYWNRTCATLGK